MNWNHEENVPHFEKEHEVYMHTSRMMSEKSQLPLSSLSYCTTSCYNISMKFVCICGTFQGLNITPAKDCISNIYMFLRLD